MVFSLVGAVDIVQTKFTLPRVKQKRKVLFKAITIEEGDLTPVCTQLQIKGGRVFKSWDLGVGIIGHGCLLIGFTKRESKLPYLYDRR